MTQSGDPSEDALFGLEDVRWHPSMHYDQGFKNVIQCTDPAAAAIGHALLGLLAVELQLRPVQR